MSPRHTPISGYGYRHFGSFRLVLALLVMVQHFTADLAPEPLAKALAPYAVGSVAVLVFFALSGFVITEAVDRIYRERPVAFLGNRMLRIVPHFLLAVLLSMVAHEIFRAAGGERLWRSQPSFPDNAFGPVNMLLNLVGILPATDRFIDYNFLDITWAVRVEMAFYLVMGGCIAVGRKLPWARGFVLVGTAVLLLMLLPITFLAVQGRGIGMLAFIPYFTFGSGLYFASKNSRIGWFTVALSVPTIVWQFVVQQAGARTLSGASSSLTGNLIVLGVLLSILTFLARSKFTRWRGADRTLGDLTYPLYLYHEDVLVFVLTFTAGYSYGVFVAGLLLSVLASIALTALIDPVVNRYRDWVRGATLDRSRPLPQPMILGERTRQPKRLLSEVRTKS